MDADIDARPGDRGGEEKEGRRRAWRGEREHRRAGEARSRVPRRKRPVMGHVDERHRPGVDHGRPFSPDRLPEAVRDQLRREVREHDLEEQPGPTPPDRQDPRDHQPDESLPADPRKSFEDRVQPAGPVMDGPALEVAVVAQAGSSCLACSISCWGSKGLPRNPCAPRAVASAASRSSTFPLNITTGIAPTSWRSWTRRSISQPSTSGIITSSRIRSGDTSSSTARPSSALLASRTPYPSISRFTRTYSRTRSSSSTISTSGPCGTLPPGPERLRKLSRSPRR